MNRQGIHLRGNQRESSPYYVYLDEEDCDETSILLPNISQSRSRKIEVINVEVKPGDTLQALALRYSCTISALKQINKIDKENEIHAKPYIKVPVQPFSVLTETECNNTTSIDSNEESTDEESNLIPTSSNTQSSGSEINTIILNSVCTPLSSQNNGSKILHVENNSLLSNRQCAGITKDLFSCSGDDCGLSWRQLFTCAFLIVFVIPIICIYIYLTNMFGHTLNNINTTETN